MMKNWNSWLLTALSLGLAGAAAATEFVHESASLLSASADVNGDGRADVVLVDKPTGVVTVGVRLADGSLSFRLPVASGVPEVSGMAVGRLLAAGRDALALAAPGSNRVQVLPLDVESLQPFHSHFPLPGPRHLAAFGSGPVEGLALAAGLGAELSLRLLTPAQPGVFQTTGSGSSQAELTGWNPVTLARGGTPRLAYLEQGAGGSTLRIHALPAGSYADPVSMLHLPAQARYTYGQFDSAKSDFFIYLPGSDKISVFRVAPDEKDLLPGVLLNAPGGVAQVLRLKGQGMAADRLLVLFEDGAARVYDYTLAGGLVLHQSLDLSGDPGAVQSAVALGDGSFALLTGQDADGRPLAHRLFGHGPAGYVAHSGGALPALAKAPAAWGNVFFFNGQPFLEEDVQLVGLWSVGDWSSGMVFGGTASADGESFVSSTLGLGSRFTRQFSPLPAGAAGALANQYRDDISLSRLDSSPAVLGEYSGGVSIRPHGGTFDTSVQVSLVAAQAGATLYCRVTGQAEFDFYTAPFRLVKDSTVEAYAQLPGGKRTPVATARFRFSAAPEKQDSDGDGVPDFVERQRGLDPEGGADSDGDGFSDLEELIAGTLPTDASSQPEERLDNASRLNLSILPRPWDGTANSAAYAVEGLSVECHEVSGALLGQGTTDKPLGQPLAAFACQPVEAQQRLLVVSTPLHYKLRSDAATSRTSGRELIGLVAVPDHVPTAVDYTFPPGGNETQEAQNWIQAAAAAYRSVLPPLVIKSLGVDETLAFLLAEARIGDLLQFRGAGGSSSGFTLTPFRDHESRDPFQPSSVSSAQLLQLERSVGDPQYSASVQLRSLLDHYETVVRNSSQDPGVEMLKRLAREVYRVSSLQHEDDPAALKPPVDALRQFIRFISLDQAYADRISLTEEEMQSIYPIIYPLRQEAPVRPHVKMTLKIPSAGTVPADGQTYARSLDESALYTLVNARGGPFSLPGHFKITPGSEFHLVAYTDLPAREGTAVLEVFSATLTAIPLPSIRDADGNLLPDEWELLFFGSTGQDALASRDGGGYSLLQEFLAGTDPTSSADSPAEPPASFSFSPVLQTEKTESGVNLEFQWSGTFGDIFEFVLQESTDLVRYTPVEASFTALGADRFRTQLPAPGTPNRFYRVGVRLK